MYTELTFISIMIATIKSKCVTSCFFFPFHIIDCLTTAYEYSLAYQNSLAYEYSFLPVSDFTDLQAHIFIVSNIHTKMQLVSYIGPH